MRSTPCVLQIPRAPLQLLHGKVVVDVNVNVNIIHFYRILIFERIIPPKPSRFRN